MARFYIDITDLLQWTKRRTGIQRVTHNVIVGYSKQQEIRLAYFSFSLKRFFEVSVEDYLTRTTGGGRRESQGYLSSRYTVFSLAYNQARVLDFNHGDKILLLGGEGGNCKIWDTLTQVHSKYEIEIYHFVHDVMPTTHPQFFLPKKAVLFGRYIKRAFSTSTAVMTSSTFNLSCINELTVAGILQPAPVRVVPLGHFFSYTGTPSKPKLSVSSRGYILMVGTLEIRKNLNLVYQVIRLARDRGVKLPVFVLAGQRGWLTGDTLHLLAHDPIVRDSVRITSDISDRELAWLYDNCLFTFYPSFSEGWGLPIGEALSFGRMCLCSSTSAMPEVGSSFAAYFNPYNAAECLQAIVDHLDASTLANAEKHIRQNFKPRTWEEVAAHLARVVGNLS